MTAKLIILSYAVTLAAAMLHAPDHAAEFFAGLYGAHIAASWLVG